MRAAVAAGLALALCLSVPVRADEAERGTLSLLVENDIFFDTDRDYTNGLMTSYTLGPDLTPGWLNDAACQVPLFKVPADDCSANRVRRSLEFGWVIACQRLQVAFTHVFRTKEYHTQPGVDQFGPVSLSYTF